MRDKRDYVIAGLAAALLFGMGLLVGQGVQVLPGATAQDGFQPDEPVDTQKGGGGTPGITIQTDPLNPSGLGGRRSTTSYTATDSDSNNRFVAVTTPIGSGESALFLIDAKLEQLLIYRFQRNKGLEFLAGRKIDMDLKITEYRDISEFSRNELKRQYQKETAKAAAKFAKKGG